MRLANGDDATKGEVGAPELLSPLPQSAPRLSEPGVAPAASAVPPSPDPVLGAGVSGMMGGSPVRSAGAGPGSGAPSHASTWSSARPGTPTTLTNTVLRPYQPAKESLERRRDRVTRQAAALEKMGDPQGNGVLEMLLEKSNL